MVKNQVFEMLSGVCLYSPEGYDLMLSSLEHFKAEKSQRYRFSILMSEMQNCDNLVLYQTTILMFINSMLIATHDFTERRSIRNELIGLGLLEVLTSLRHQDEEDDDLRIQIQHFDESKQDDDELLGSSDEFGELFCTLTKCRNRDHCDITCVRHDTFSLSVCNPKPSILIPGY